MRVMRGEMSHCTRGLCHISTSESGEGAVKLASASAFAGNVAVSLLAAS